MKHHDRQPFGKQITRRHLLRVSAGTVTAALLGGSVASLLAGPDSPRFKIGACDWSIGKMADPGAFEVGKQIGLDGVQVSLGTEAKGMELCKPERQQQYLAAAKSAGLQVASLAIGELNNVPYKSDGRTTAWVSDGIDAAKALGVECILLAFFGKGDLRGDKAGVDSVVSKLKEVAPKAEKAGVKLGIESWLSAREHLEILDRVGSSSVQVYYDVCNSNDMGYDIYREIRDLGRRRICEFHAKENGSLLGKGKVDFKRVREALDDIQYRGWIQIEGAVPPGKPMLEAYKANCAFMRETFNA